jgi:hypothetical protein
MSTYLSGTPTFLPSVQPYEPNLQLYAGALQMKQTQYDTNRKKISNLYGSLLNSSLTRQNNINARDEFFNTIDYEIKKLANVDLSLEQNVSQATKLFSGLYENKNIIKDMMWTKNYQSQVERGEGFRNCVDPEKCGGQFWQGGLDALEYQRQEFQNMSDDEAMGYHDVTYTPFINVGEKANQIFKDYGWNVKMDSPSADGKWIITTKNGEQIIGPVYSHLQSIIGKDPAIAEYYRTKSYLDRKTWVSGNTAQYGSEDAALQEYINQKSKEINDAIGNINQDAQYAKENTKRRAEDLKENIESGKVRDTTSAQSEYERLFGESESHAETEKVTSTALTSTQNSLASQNLRYQAETLDGASALLNLNMDLYDSAKILAYKDYEQTYKVNDYALAQQNHMFRMQEIQKRADLEYENDKKLLDLEMQGQQLLNERFLGALASDVDTDPNAAFNRVNELANEATATAYTNTQEVFRRTYDAAKTKVQEGGNGSAQAELDLIKMTDEFLNQYVSQATQQGAADAGEMGKMYEKFKNGTTQYKLAFAKSYDMSKDFGKLNQNMLNAAYKYSVKGMYSGDQSNINRTYLGGIREQLSYKVLAADEALTSVEKWKEAKVDVYKRAAEVARTKGDTKYADYYESLVTKQGGIANENQFALNVAEKAMKNAQNASSQATLDDYKKIFNENFATRKQWIDQNLSTKLSESERKALANGTGDYAEAYEMAKNKFAEQMVKSDTQKRTDAKGQPIEPGIDKKNLPNVYITKGGIADGGGFFDGERVAVPYTEFFDDNGLVRAKYAKYADTWEHDDNAFWQTYNEAKALYKGDAKPGGVLGAAGLGAATGGAFGGPIGAGIGALFAGPLNYMYGGEGPTINDEFLNSFKEVFTDKYVTGAAEEQLGLMGIGSGTTQSLDGYVDYSAPLSKNVLEEQSFLRDAFGAIRDKDVFFSFGKAGNSLPGMSNVQAEQFVKQLLGQAIKSGKGSKPTWLGSYNATAGGSRDWQSYTIMVNDPTFLKDFVGTKDNPGMYYEYFKDNKEGAVTMYLKDSAAQNALHVQTKVPEIEKLLTVKGSVPIAYGKYDGGISKLTMTRNPTGGYYVNGSVATGVDDVTNDFIYEPLNLVFNSGADNASLINEQLTQVLDQLNLNVISQMNNLMR